MNRISVFYEHMAEAMKQENITLLKMKYARR